MNVNKWKIFKMKKYLKNIGVKMQHLIRFLGSNCNVYLNVKMV